MAENTKKAEGKAEGSAEAKLPQAEHSYPVLPVRDTVLFPHAVLPLTRPCTKS